MAETPEILTATNIDETYRIASDLAHKWLHATTPRALVIALEGELGAGKTSFTQGFAKGIGVREQLTSPTFVIMKQYPIPDMPDSQYRQLVHIDAYRLAGSQDLVALGIEELVADPRNIILIEWPERVPEIIPADHITIRLEHLSEFQRKISILNTISS